jgi:hypothetical protein
MKIYSKIFHTEVKMNVQAFIIKEAQAWMSWSDFDKELLCL